MTNKKYTVLFDERLPELKGQWDGVVWKEVSFLAIDYFRPEGSKHHPHTLCKLRYNADMLYGIFLVDDQFVRCVHRGLQADVYKDSCVELFVQPQVAQGYFNFEFNCGGAMLASYVTDPARVAGRVREFVPLTPEHADQIQRNHSLPAIVDPEITQKTIWLLEFSIPFAILEKYAGKLGKVRGQTWRANFYKCGNETSHPHWGAWSPIDELNFHLPAYFGNIHFA
jgi:hypothetical protein